MTDHQDTGTITARDADRLRWQRDALRVLSDLLAAGAAADLPAIHWTIGPTGAVVGECLLGGGAGSSEERERAFSGWRYAVVQLADAVPDEEWRRTDLDQDRLWAAWKQPRSLRMVTVVLKAALWHDEDLADVDQEAGR